MVFGNRPAGIPGMGEGWQHGREVPERPLYWVVEAGARTFVSSAEVHGVLFWLGGQLLIAHQSIEPGDAITSSLFISDRNP